MQGLVEPEGEDEGILINVWSASALGRRIAAK